MGDEEEGYSPIYAITGDVHQTQSNVFCQKDQNSLA